MYSMYSKYLQGVGIFAKKISNKAGHVLSNYAYTSAGALPLYTVNYSRTHPFFPKLGKKI